MRAGRIITDVRGSLRRSPRARAGTANTRSSDINLQSLQTASRLHCMALKKIDAFRSFALICLNMIFFYPTASVISFSFSS